MTSVDRNILKLRDVERGRYTKEEFIDMLEDEFGDINDAAVDNYWEAQGYGKKINKGKIRELDTNKDRKITRQELQTKISGVFDPVSEEQVQGRSAPENPQQNNFQFSEINIDGEARGFAEGLGAMAVLANEMHEFLTAGQGDAEAIITSAPENPQQNNFQFSWLDGFAKRLEDIASLTDEANKFLTAGQGDAEAQEAAMLEQVNESLSLFKSTETMTAGLQEKTDLSDNDINDLLSGLAPRTFTFMEGSIIHQDTVELFIGDGDGKARRDELLRQIRAGEQTVFDEPADAEVLSERLDQASNILGMIQSDQLKSYFQKNLDLFSEMMDSEKGISKGELIEFLTVMELIVLKDQENSVL